MNVRSFLRGSVPKKGVPRLLALDILRAAAVLLVLGRHAPEIPSGSNDLFEGLAALWFRVGWIGVDIFFVLSGFLVSGLLFREYVEHGKLDVKNFFIRRGFKIYPSFYLLLLTSVVLDLELGTRKMAWHWLVGEMVYLRNYGWGIWNHTWSLAVEEHFYIILPIALVLLIRFFPGNKNPFKILPQIILVLVLLVFVARVLTLVSGDPDGLSRMLHATHLRLDSLAFGVFLGYFYTMRRDSLMSWIRQYRWLILMGGILLLTPALVSDLETDWWMPTIGFTLFYVASGMILLAALSFEIPHNHLTRTFAYIGAQSYSIYIWHMAVVVWVMPEIVQLFGLYFNYTIKFILYFIATLVIGCLLGELIERPMLHLRDRFFPSNSKPVSVKPAPPQAERIVSPVPSAE